MVLIFLQNALSALTVVFSKSVVHQGFPLFFLMCRHIVSGLLIVSGVFLFTKKFIRVNKDDRFLFAQIVLFQTFGAYYLEIAALRNLTAAYSTFFFNLAPFCGAFFSYIFFNERMTRVKLLGFGCALIGFWVLFVNATAPGDSSATEPFSVVSALLMIVAVIGNTYGYIVMRVLIKKRDYPSSFIAGISMLGGGVCAFAASLLVEFGRVLPSFSDTLFGYHVAGIVLASCAAYSLNSFLLHYYTVTLLSFMGFLYAVFGALYGYIFFKEPISYSFISATMLVITGLYLFYKEELRQGYIQR